MIQRIRKKFIGNKAFYIAVFAIAIPLMLQSLITSSVNLVDNLMVGQLGDTVISAVASVNRFYMIANFGTNGIVAAAAIFLAQYYGANNKEKMKEAYRFGILCALLIIAPFFLLAMFVPESIIGFFSHDPALVEIGVGYLKIVGFSFVPAAISIALYSSMRSVGETKYPLMVSVFAVFTNAFLNYVLIFGHLGFPELGVQGAAIATLIARTLEMIVIISITYGQKFEYRSRIRDLFKVDGKLAKAIMLKGLPLALNEVLWAGGMATILKIYGTRGVVVMSGYSIASTSADIFFSLFSGMAIATTVLISQKLGANELDEARDNGYKLIGTSFMMAFVMGALLFLSAFFVPNLFSVSEEAKIFARNILVIMSLFFWIYMTTAQMYFILRAGGDTKSTLIMDASYMWLVNIPLLAVFAYFTSSSIYVIYILGQLTDIVKLGLAYVLVKKEKWVKNLTEHLHD